MFEHVRTIFLASNISSHQYTQKNTIFAKRPSKTTNTSPLVRPDEDARGLLQEVSERAASLFSFCVRVAVKP